MGLAGHTNNIMLPYLDAVGEWQSNTKCTTHRLMQLHAQSANYISVANRV